MKRKNYNLMIGGAITLFFLAVALIGQFWTPYGTMKTTATMWTQTA